MPTTLVSPADLVGRMLQRQLAKQQWLRCSDWEQRPLTNEQIAYAATDAFASFRVWEVRLTNPSDSICPCYNAARWLPLSSHQSCYHVQILQTMPIVETAAAAVQPCARADAEHVFTQHVAARVEAGYLQPAKLAVYNMHMQQVCVKREQGSIESKGHACQ